MFKNLIGSRQLKSGAKRAATGNLGDQKWSRSKEESAKLTLASDDLGETKSIGLSKRSRKKIRAIFSFKFNGKNKNKSNKCDTKPEEFHQDQPKFGADPQGEFKNSKGGSLNSEDIIRSETTSSGYHEDIEDFDEEHVADVEDNNQDKGDDDQDDLDNASFVTARSDLGYPSSAETSDPSSSEMAPSNQKNKDQAVKKTKSADEEDEGGLPEEECDIPTFLHTPCCDRWLIDETRRLLKERYEAQPDSIYDRDYERMQTDDWTVSRFLLRRRLDPKRTAKLMEECGLFRKQYKMSEVQLWEFPVEFHKAGGLFKYAPDRVGNVTLFMRVKMYRRVPEISDVFKAFILCVLEECDRANNGRGTAVIFDLSSCGLQNVDLGFLSWLLSSFRNYCPKGVSYIIVYNLPWFLNATCKLAMSWMSASNRRALRFCHGKEIENFIARENLPDYCGGTCPIDYRAIPEGSKPAIEVCDRIDITPKQAMKIREIFKQYLGEDDDLDGNDTKSNKSKSNKTKGKHKHVEQVTTTKPNDSNSISSNNRNHGINIVQPNGDGFNDTSNIADGHNDSLTAKISKASKFLA